MWIEIFKKGNHTDSSGNSKSYTDEDIKMIVANYNKKVQESDSFEAPIVKGHPGSDEPAYGWVEKLQKKGDLILAKLKDVTPELMKEIRDGRFKKVSVALYSDLMLRHVGLLGAMPPAIKGLKNVAFTENKYSEINQEFDNGLNLDNKFSEELNEMILFNADLKNKYDELIIEKNNLKNEINKIKYDEFINNIQNKLHINKQVSENIFSFFEELNEADKSNNLINKFQNILLNIENNNLNTSYYDKLNTSQDNTFSELNNVNKDRLKLHEQTIEILNNNPTLNYEEALLLVK